MTTTVGPQALYRRWRAQTFAEIVGQQAVVETLRNAVRTDRVSHAVLFVGPRGTGKTSLARILAKAVNCTDLRDGDACDACPSCVSIREGTTLDLIEIDAASNRGIDAVRDLRERLPYPPGQLRRKVYILDEAHQITRDAWNALLKSLEEPPDFVNFMFASTEPSGFPPAILSRLQRFDVRRLTVPEIEGKLTRILATDNRQADPAAIHLIARLAAGGMRDAESMLDQLLSAAPERIDESTVRDLLGLADSDVVEAFVDHLVSGDGAAGVALLDALDERGRDVRALLDQAVDAIRAELMAGLADPSAPRHDPIALAAAGRRLAAIDPNRATIGGLRFQLELAMFGAGTPSPAGQAGSSGLAVTATPAEAAVVETPGPGRTDRTRAEPRRIQSPAPAPVVAAPPSSEAAAPDETPSVRSKVDRAAAEPALHDTPASASDDGSGDDGSGPRERPAEETAPAGKETHESVAPAAATSPAGDGGPRTHPAAARTPDDGDRGPTNVPVERPGAPSPPPKPAASETGAARGQAADADPALAEILAAWPAIVEHLSAHPPTKPLIVRCRPVAVDGAIVTLGFPEEQAFLKDQAERRRPGIEAGIAAVIGHPVTVRCVVANVELATASDDLVAEARRIFADELADVGEVS